MDVVSNNLANSATQGYKADTLAFSDVLVQSLYADGGAGGYIAALATVQAEFSNAIDHSVGVIKPTGNSLDVAIRTEKRNVSQSKRTARPFYTRDGAFMIDNNKQLVTSQGLLVLDGQGKRS